MELDSGKQIHLFTVVPIYDEELDFELKHGMHEFFDQLVKNEVSTVVDLTRLNFGLLQ